LASGALRVKLWDLATGKEIATLNGYGASVTSLAFSPDGMSLASGSLDHRVGLWRLSPENGWEIHATLDAHTHGVRSVAFSPDGSVLASAGQDKTIRLWDLATGDIVRVMGQEDHIFYCSVAFSPDGRTLASGNADGSITLWDVNTGEVIRTIFRQGPQNWNGHTASALSIAFSPDGRFLASGSQDRTVKLWEIETGSILQTLTEHGNTVHSVAFSPDGRRLASASSDQTARLWDLQDALPAAHAITNIRFDPPSSAALGFNDRVTFTFDYSTTDPGGVRVFATLMTGGSRSPGQGHGGYRLYPAGEGSGSAFFTISSVEQTVDQVHLQMWDSDQTRLLYETFVDVRFTFRGDAQPNQPPVAQFAFSPASPTVSQMVTFDGSGSHDPDGSIQSYAWQFGDGATGIGSSATHTYSSVGSYTVQLRVTDNQGATGTTTQTVSVGSADDGHTEAPEAATAAGREVELAYDGGTPETGYGWAFADRGYAVRFTPPSEDTVLLTARLYVFRVVRAPAPIRIHVWDAARVEMIEPFEVTPTETGWFDVDLSAFALRVGDGDFYVGYTQTLADKYPLIGLDAGDTPTDRSYHIPAWSAVLPAGANMMIRAVVSVERGYPFAMHSITNIRFDPPSPATLEFNDRVTFTFDYTTTEPGGVYIWGTPFTGGSLPGGSAMHGSVLHPMGEGSLSGFFTITAGAKTVDQVRFRMTDADRNVLYEALVDVSYTYR
ncbi:MAG: PKD domain-containing protein, partial [Candidatus Bipolaricaulota bacterium]